MNDAVRMWTEIVFNIAYLGVIYTFVVLMSRELNIKKAGLSGTARSPEAVSLPLLRLFRNGFLLLAIGDTGHVGFRVIAYMLGGLESSIPLGPVSIPLVGLGALSTAYTVTILYMMLLSIWRIRYEKQKGYGYLFLMALGYARLVLMALPGNQWGEVIPPFGWSLLRNTFLTALGLAVAVLMLRDGIKYSDKPFKLMGILIFISYGFYIPVILLVQRVPAIGMLMIPKTVAYVVMAWVGYRDLFRKADR